MAGSAEGWTHAEAIFDLPGICAIAGEQFRVYSMRQGGVTHQATGRRKYGCKGPNTVPQADKINAVAGRCGPGFKKGHAYAGERVERIPSLISSLIL